MFQNNNQKIVNKIAMRSFKANRLRNIFTILAIILTTVLITSVFTMGISLMESFKQSELRMYGHYAHGNFKLLTTEQYEKIKKHPLVKEYGMGIMVSNADNNVFMKKPCEIWYLDKNDAKYRFSTPTIGKLPEKENEIAMETWVLDMLEVPHKLGSTVNLEYRITDKQYKKKFELSGFWEGNKNLAIAGTAIVSMDFINKNLSHINQMESIKNNDYTGLISMGVMFDSEVGIDNKMNQIVTDMGYEARRGYPPKYINYGEHPAYHSRNLTDITVLLPYMAIILLVMFSGYLLIYNIFYISVVRDTRFYGLLKTVGTTSKQLKKIITKQALLLSVIGIPLGIIIGYFTGGIATRLSTKTLILEYYVISKNPSIFIGSAIFSLITVLISCRKPRKVASKISPIEAVKYAGVINSSKKIVKNNSKGVKLHKMAFLNIFRNKKKAFIVLISLSLSMIVFNFFYSLIAGYNVEKKLIEYIHSDFVVADSSIYNQYNASDMNYIPEDVYSKIKKMGNIEDLNRVYYEHIQSTLSDIEKEFIEKNKNNEKIEHYEAMEELIEHGIIDKDMFGIEINGVDVFTDDLVKKGHIDKEKFATGEFCLIGEHFYPYYDAGDKITIKTNEGKEKTLEIMAIVSPYIYTIRRYSTGGYGIYLPDNTFKELITNPKIIELDIYSKNIEELQIKKDLKKIISNYDNLLLKSKEDFIYELKTMINTISTIGFTLSGIIGIIGILNFVNTTITGIIARRQEFAMLEAVGMTKKQLKKMITFEGLYYGLITIFISFTLGSLVVNFLINLLGESFGIESYKFDIIPMILSALIVGVISLVIPRLSYKSISKSTVIERLGEIE